MFSQWCVKNSVHGAGDVWQGGVCGGGGVHGREGACVAGETATAADGTHPTGMHSCFYRPQRSWDKVIFSQASVILLTGRGGLLSQHALQVVSQHALHVSGEGSAPSGVCGLLLCPSGLVAFWFEVQPSGMVFWGEQKAITEGHRTRRP